MGAPRQHIRRKVRIGVRLPANHDEIAGEVAQQNVVLDLRVLCGTSHAEAHVPVRGSVKCVCVCVKYYGCVIAVPIGRPAADGPTS